MPSPRWGSLLAAMAVVVATSITAYAHPAQLVAAVAHVDENGEFQTRVTFDALAYLLNDTPADVDHAAMDQLLDGPTDVLERRLAEARERFGRALVVRCRAASAGAAGGGSAETIVRGEVVKFPEAEDVLRWRDSGRKPRLPVIQEAIVRGRLPAGTTAIAFRFPEVLGSIVLTVERPGEEPYADALEGGRASTWLPVSLNVDAVVADPTTQNDVPATMPATHAARAAHDGHVGTAALRYLALGFHHIVPRGPDHILFVLGLFLLSTKVRPLLWQVTAFTVAHSITLGLSLYGVVRLPPAVVEPLIAASIAFVAIENLFTSELKPWRPFVVFGFGLVHGLGFAGVLSDAGLPRQQFATALVAFNVGVELGQLSVIAAAFAAVGWWRGKTWYRGVIVVPASCAIAIVAVVWTVQRVWNGG